MHSDAQATLWSIHRQLLVSQCNAHFMNERRNDGWGMNTGHFQISNKCKITQILLTMWWILIPSLASGRTGRKVWSMSTARETISVLAHSWIPPLPHSMSNSFTRICERIKKSKGKMRVVWEWCEGGCNEEGQHKGFGCSITGGPGRRTMACRFQFTALQSYKWHQQMAHTPQT